MLPSLHAWIWLPQVRGGPPPLRAGGPRRRLPGAGPARWLGRDPPRPRLRRPWYLAQLAAVGYIRFPTLLVAAAWIAVAAQLTAIAVGRYAPYPDRGGTGTPRPDQATRAQVGAGGRAPRPLRRAPARRRALEAEDSRRRSPSASSPSPRATRTSASAPAARAIMCDSRPGQRLDDECRQARSPVGRARARRDRDCASTSHARAPRSNRGQRIAKALEREQRGPHEELEADQDGDRIPGQAEHEPPPARRRTRSACPASRRRPRRPPRRRAQPRIARTRSCGPTDTPPEVTRTSASSPRASASRCASSSSATEVRRSASAPAEASCASSRIELAS